MASMKTRALQRYWLKLQINRTQISNDRQNAVLYSLSCYAIFVWFDDSIAINALGNWLYVIHTCPSLFLPTLKSLYLYAFIKIFFLISGFFPDFFFSSCLFYWFHWILIKTVCMLYVYQILTIKSCVEWQISNCKLRTMKSTLNFVVHINTAVRGYPSP